MNHSRVARHILLLCILSITVVSCRSRDQQHIADLAEVNPGSVYLDYSLEGSEEGAEATLVMQFRMQGPNGPALKITAPAKLTFDGKAVPMDSAAVVGPWYEARIPLAEFASAHVVEFTGTDQQRYVDTIYIRAFTLAGFPDTISRADTDVSVEVKGVGQSALMQVVITDTSSFSEGIDRMDSVRNGRLILPPEYFATLANGPVLLELFSEQVEKLKKAPPRGGRLRVSYNVKRSFELRP